MKIYDAYKSLTDAGKRQAVRKVCAFLRDEGNPVSDEYIKQVMLGLRKTACSEPVARAVSAYFRGYCQIDVGPEEVLPVEESPRHASAR